MTLANGGTANPMFRNPLEERKATWMELFFDLAFVVAIASTAHSLSSTELPAGLLEFAVLFVLLQWAWAGYTFYSDRFDSDHLVQRLVALVQMALVLTIATLQDWLGHDFIMFVGTYCLLRTVTIVANLVSGWKDPATRKVTQKHTAAIALSLLPLILAIGVEDQDLRLTLATATAVLQLVPPTLAHRQDAMPWSVTHVPERLGLFITLALGECLVGITNAGSLDPSPGGVVSGSLALLLVFCIWSIYFACLDGSALQTSRMRAVSWLYLHIPLSMSIVAMGVGLEETLRRLLDPQADGSRLMFLAWGTAVLCIAGISGLRQSPPGRRSKRSSLLLGFLGAVALVLPFATDPGPLFTLISLTAAGAVLLAMLIIRGGSATLSESSTTPPQRQGEPG